MTVSEFAEKAGCVVFSEGEEREIGSGYCGDFLSNIISRATDDCAWLTVMNYVNVAAVATLIDCACIILCEGVAPDEAFARARKTARAVGARRRGERVRGGEEGGGAVRGIKIHENGFAQTLAELKVHEAFTCLQ